jgi:hypothetical protein
MMTPLENSGRMMQEQNRDEKRDNNGSADRHGSDMWCKEKPAAVSRGGFFS